MLAKVVAGIVVALTVLCSDPAPLLRPAAALAYQTEGSQTTRMMQQMDHRQRLNEQERAQDRARVATEAGVIGADPDSTGNDYAVAGVLGVTGAVLYTICRRRRCRPRRQARGQAGPRT